jgi:isocitrate dehydrogenase kinase/phosphatase
MYGTEWFSRVTRVFLVYLILWAVTALVRFIGAIIPEERKAEYATGVGAAYMHLREARYLYRQWLAYLR